MPRGGIADVGSVNANGSGSAANQIHGHSDAGLTVEVMTMKIASHWSHLSAIGFNVLAHPIAENERHQRESGGALRRLQGRLPAVRQQPMHQAGSKDRNQSDGWIYVSNR